MFKPNKQNKMIKRLILFALCLHSGILMAQTPVISNPQLNPVLTVVRFSPYKLSAVIDPKGTEINSVQAEITPLLGGNVLPTNYYVNGSAYDEGTITRTLTYRPDTLTNYYETNSSNYIYPDQIYPEIFFMPSNITNNNVPQNKRVSAGNYDLMHFQNPLAITPQTSFFIEFYATPDNSPPYSVDLLVYLVGKGKDISFFNSSTWTSDASAELVGSISKDALFNHSHSVNSRHHLVALAANANSTVGTKNLDVTGDFWIVLTTSHSMERRGWDLKYHSGRNNFSRWYSGSGTNYPVQTLGAPDVHVHIAKNAGDATGDGVRANYTVNYNSNLTTSNLANFYFGTIPNLPPNKGSFILPVPGTYSGNITISWQPVTDPNNDVLNYTVDLLNTDGTFYKNIATDILTTSTTFNAATLGVATGIYDIRVTAKEVGTNPVLSTPFIWSSNSAGDFLIENNPTSITWNGSSTTAWATSGNWTGGTPGPTVAVTIPSTTNKPVIASGTYEVGNLTIATGASLTLESGAKLTVHGDINNSANPGIIIKSGGSLLHNATTMANLEHTIAKDNDWHFLSIPIMQEVMPEILDGNFAPLIGNFNETTGPTYDFYKWGPAENAWINLKKSDWTPNITDFGNPPRFEQGVGYLVAYSSGFSGNETKTITGTLANGPSFVSLSTANGGYNLVANPYPSSIDWKAASGWTRTDLGEFESYNVWIYNDDDDFNNFGAYNSSSGEEIGINGMSRHIPPFQAFYVKAATAGYLEMTDDVRVHSSQAWLKKGLTQAGTFRLKVVQNNQSNADEIMLEFGRESDAGGAEKMYSYNPASPALYTIKNEGQFSIDFRQEITDQKTIQLGFKAGEAGIYSFVADGNEAFGQLFLEDRTLGTQHNLKLNPVYTFSASITDDPERFLLHFGTVGVNETLPTMNPVVFMANNQLHINKLTENASLRIIDVQGKEITTMHLQPGDHQLSLNVSTGIYMLVFQGKSQTSASKIFMK